MRFAPCHKTIFPGAVLFAIAVTGGACANKVDPQLIADAQTAARVKTVLVNDPEIGSRLIEVRVSRGVVRLTGSVVTPAEGDRAVALARSVAGVVRVDSELQIRGGVSRDGSRPEGGSVATREWGFEEASRRRDWLAIGLSANRQSTADDRLSTSWTFYPLIRLGARRGFGPALGFSWFSAPLDDRQRARRVGRVRVKPVMAGVGYTLGGRRNSASFSIVGGYAFNRFTLEDVPAGEGVPVGIGNSPVLRPGFSLWHDPNGRIAVNVSAGYIITRPRLELLRAGRLETTALRADTASIGVGLAWKLF